MSREISCDCSTLQDACAHPRRGLHQFLRLSNVTMRQRFVQLVDVERIPVAFLHGNPHLDNYAKTDRGSAMVDFDRARFGPYAYDLVRFWVSLSVRRATRDHRLMHPVVLASFRRGYAFGARGLGHEAVDRLMSKRPKKWERSTRAYVAADGPWARRMRAHAIDPRRPRIRALWASYLASRDEDLLHDDYAIARAGEVMGSMGKRHLLLLLEPRDRHADQRLLDIKETYDEPDEGPFRSPYPHQGQRMVAAGELHCPGWERAPGWATHGGRQYWCRDIPTHKLKLPQKLSEFEQVDLAFAVASQLGRAHRQSMVGLSADEHLEHFERALDHWVEVATQLRRELELCHGHYVYDVLAQRDRAPRRAVG
ncbi:MAG: DUF2252 family protein [Myxococcales bacterium]|nr:DUF2252 family protein [Myxococcales bacterium]